MLKYISLGISVQLTRSNYCDRSHADPEGVGLVSGPPPEKSQSYRVSQQYWLGSPEKSQIYQCWAIIGQPAKRYFAGWPMMACL